VLADVCARFGPRVPVLVLSAIAEDEDVQAAGADAYLRKPYAVEALVETIRPLLAA
jgi:CheY-like chemotaxis protein